MTTHLRLLAVVATFAALTAAAACDRVVELYSIDAPPYEPPAIDAGPTKGLPPPPPTDASYIDAPVFIDAPAFIDAPYGTDAAVDAPFVAPPAPPTSERTRT